MGQIFRPIENLFKATTSFIPSMLGIDLWGDSSGDSSGDVKTLTASEPTAVTPMAAAESRNATIRAAEDDEAKRRKAAAAGRSSLVTSLQVPSALGTGVGGTTPASTTGVGTGL